MSYAAVFGSPSSRRLTAAIRYYTPMQEHLPVSKKAVTCTNTCGELTTAHLFLPLCFPLSSVKNTVDKELDATATTGLRVNEQVMFHGSCRPVETRRDACVCVYVGLTIN